MALALLLRSVRMTTPARLARAVVLALLACLPLIGGCGEDESAEAQFQPSSPTIAVPPPKEVLRLPKKPGSYRFAALGDMGRGDRWQYDVSKQMQAFRKEFPFNFVIMIGDNIYDGATPDDYLRKFEQPYKPFLDDGVEFHAAIGNHDEPNQPNYAPFHMGGRRYYTFKPKPPLIARLADNDVQFFMIDTENVDRTQREWLDRELGKSDARWKIAVFHRPIYTSGRYSLWATWTRGSLEPIFMEHHVQVVLSGHEHFYERTKPLNGTTYFISGAGGSLRPHDIRASDIMAAGFDTDYSFMLWEIAGDEAYFQSISRTGTSVDSGVIHLTTQDTAR
jgi:Calcineurin-like phosphoesterase